MAKYVMMVETDQMPEPGNCDSCELNCSYYMSWWDKQNIIDASGIRIHCLNDFYCPIRAVVDIESFLKWKAEHPEDMELKMIEGG